MPKWWKEVWSLGSGARRVYCGIARTVDGFAVDLFRGDSCIESDIYVTRAEAEHAAGHLRGQYVRRTRPSNRALRPGGQRPGHQSGSRAVA